MLSIRHEVRGNKKDPKNIPNHREKDKQQVISLKRNDSNNLLSSITVNYRRMSISAISAITGRRVGDAKIGSNSIVAVVNQRCTGFWIEGNILILLDIPYPEMDFSYLRRLSTVR